MTEPTVRPQTTLRISGQIVLAALIMGVLRAVMDSSGVEVIWNREAFLQGVYFGVLAVIWEYRSLPASHRLAPLPTILLGMLVLSAITALALTAPRPLSEWGWAGRILLLFFALIPLYLVTSGARALLKDRGVAA